MNINEFYQGKTFDAYKNLGAHICDTGVLFRTYAPNAKGVNLLHGGNEIPMYRAENGHFFQVFVDGAKEWDVYEYRIYDNHGGYTDHCDPYGYGMQLRPDHKSVVRSLYYEFNDEHWMANRGNQLNQPMNIYEMHIGSWKKPGENNTDWYTYWELPDLLIPYLKESGFNYVEFLPLSEHPCDESWGYQNTGFFAPTSRYGVATALKYLVDRLHQKNIGVILDFVPVHYAIDDYALAKYDGTCLYEYADKSIGMSEWGSCNFNHSRGEVRSFLQSCANYWLNEYHFDGLRIDAVSRIIYWQGDERRGVNLEAINFIKNMNKGLKERNPGCMIFAEDSSCYPYITKPLDEGGLGFDYKWNMGWMHDTLEFFKMSPKERKNNYSQLTHSMSYFYSEKFLLSLSHDEVVHEKATIIQKMNSHREVKFPQARVLYLYMMTHPGKKLNFMGNEIGQFREWDEKREQDWHLLQQPEHQAFYRYMVDLNKTYMYHPALFDNDYGTESFEWIDNTNSEQCTYAFKRQSCGENLIIIMNLSDELVQNYMIQLPWINSAEIIMNTDWDIYGGITPAHYKGVTVEAQTIHIDINGLSAIMIKVW